MYPVHPPLAGRDDRDLSFEGDELGDEQERGLNGAYFLDSGGRAENCRFTGLREKVPGTISCLALRFLNDLPGAPLYSVREAGNTIRAATPASR